MPDNQLQIGKATLSLAIGDITRQEVDAIVNAANTTLMGGGGVDGAIHRAGGPAILQECKQIRETSGRCQIGCAVITGGGNLKARYVIHAVGPIWHGGNANEATLLAGAYSHSLKLAAEAKVSSVAFPSISTGAYGFPVVLASAVALTTVKEFLRTESTVNDVRFLLFDSQTYDAYVSALKKVGT
ncbi:MAG: O-acetyl-ADP-ribose deacetylase [Candidatus Obscuribacterales bacterium]|nr:O-acetyl-ADP-ribose deacetylase [Candidatus Obscuribacterales bacterium]